jgi:hypothetical protein
VLLTTLSTDLSQLAKFWALVEFEGSLPYSGELVSGPFSSFYYIIVFTVILLSILREKFTMISKFILMYH